MQSEPEEMPPEAKMRMKNIGRYRLYFTILHLASVVSFEIFNFFTSVTFLGKRQHLQDLIPSTRANRDFPIIKSFGKGSSSPKQKTCK